MRADAAHQRHRTAHVLVAVSPDLLQIRTQYSTLPLLVLTKHGKTTGGHL
ncbi:hypothetical protein PC116_g18327 [Phytophthora cactorum]|uniref:Uncharacterized protein n=1 Tax=Phytophthora cactorum TaxID=29920 RepID=A0A8T1BGV9_9STRA|nr:hypothetical protein PC114_g15448 [Phytophthora cactorum]KAG2902921.1 hypothetical protein PC117_g21373 [Phytophthora cactorum]KAG3000272.1 hypothetical protein PC120_g20723 [Phytophthora cactorum]KAG3022551.1 hypothetical protein PC119_g9246 [Phytophthora cactorum]KAG3152724.1 hypothetical protein C6341_g16184 [Phytophthora cactorum]